MLVAVDRPRGWRQRLARAFEPIPVGPDERARVATNAHAAIVASLAGSALAILTNLLARAPRSAAILGGFFLLDLGCLWLLRRGRVVVAAAGLLLALIATIHALALNGDGIHDTATLLYPVVILVAAFTLDRRLLVATALLCLGSALVLAEMERLGALRPTFAGDASWEPLANVAIILLVTAVAAHILLADAARGLAALWESERRLAAANRELEARNAELERFTYVVSHDLKSPLVTVRGFLSYVERDAQAGRLDRVESDLARIRAATDRMAQLLEDLLELSRTGRIDRPHEDVPLEEVVREARSLAEGGLSARGVRVEVEGPLPVVRGDRRRLVELVQNLLDNAAKFMGDRPEPAVWIGARDAGAAAGQVALYVRDNGIGIDPAHQDRVFELFHRLDPSVEGTGLGLALARRIVETHGGRIWVESAGAGRGSTFCFSLPVAGLPPESSPSVRGGPQA
jgi:signal transduction histidine kinase